MRLISIWLPVLTTLVAPQLQASFPPSPPVSAAQCLHLGGKCLLEDTCPVRPTTIQCEEDGAVCCGSSGDVGLPKKSRLGDLGVDLRVRSCFNRKCQLWFNGRWLSSQSTCLPKNRVVSYCSRTRLWCCAPPCRERPLCLQHGGYCVTKPTSCPGHTVHRWCRAKMCFCCIPDAPRPPCSCQERNVSLCEGQQSAPLPADTCLSVLSPAYPYSYPHNSLCSLDVVTVARCKIFVEVCELFLEDCPYDLLNIIGTNISTPICGSAAPSPGLSFGNSITVSFAADSTQSGPGFRLALSTVCEPLTTTTTSTTTTTVTTTTTTMEPDCNTFPVYTMCTATAIAATTGLINSPGYPGLYPNDRFCALNISVPTGFVVSLKYLAFDLEPQKDCKWDHFRVHDASVSPDYQPAYCGTNIPPFNKSTTNAVRMEFKSDSTVIFTGFSICFRAVPQ